MKRATYGTPAADALAMRPDVRWSYSEEGDGLGESIEDAIDVAVNNSADDDESVFVFGFELTPWDPKVIGRLADCARDAVSAEVWEMYAEGAADHVLESTVGAETFRAAVLSMVERLGPIAILQFEVKVDVARWVEAHP